MRSESDLMLRSLIALSVPESVLPRAPAHHPAGFAVLPVIAGPVGLLGNLASIVALADHWREHSNGTKEADVAWVLVLNAVALASGCLSNFMISVHSYRKISALWGLVATALLYMTACCLYMGLIGGTQYAYFGETSTWQRSQGYWQAVCASVLYFVAALLLIVHLAERWHNHTLSLHVHLVEFSHAQRRLMMLFILYIGWIAMGGAVAAYLLHTVYADGVYYCVVTCLTLGYGDLVAVNALPRALTIPYLYTGLVLGGFTTIVLFQMLFTRTRQVEVTRYVDQLAQNAANNGFSSEKEAFDTMRSIVRRSELRTGLIRVCITGTWLAVFWLVGALIFSRTEDWTYFEAFYMCATSLASVGYGDFVATSPGGRSFFLHWALIALPTMTATVSDLTSIILTAGESLTRPKQRQEMSHLDIMTHDFNWASIETSGSEKVSVSEWHRMLNISRDGSNSSYSFEIWHDVMVKLVGPVSPDFWVSKNSPIRLPFLDEKRFLLLASLKQLFGDSDRGYKSELRQSNTIHGSRELDAGMVDNAWTSESTMDTGESTKRMGSSGI